MVSLGLGQMVTNLIGYSLAGFLLIIFPLVLPAVLVLRKLRSLLVRPIKIENNVVLVTGASSGIGRCMALEYARRGAKLVLAARRENRLREVAQECMENGARSAEVCRADISKPEDCKRIVDFAVETYGRLDVLVNNAGSAKSGLFEEYTDTREFKETMDVDFWGNVLPTFYALEHLRRTKGQVVVTDSVGAYVPYPRQAMYNAAKASILEFYDTMRTEPIGKRVTITLAMPGFVQSEMTLGGPPGHIPKYWPMLPTEDAAKRIVDAAQYGARYHIVPFWYWSWLPYRLLAPMLLEWPPRMFLLGQPPNAVVARVAKLLLGEDGSQKLFHSLTGLSGVSLEGR